MELASKFGLYETPYFGDPALVSPTRMRRFLFGRGFPDHLLDKFARYQWDFDQILPAVQNGTLGVPERGGWRSRTTAISRNQSDSEEILRSLAAAFFALAIEINTHAEYGKPFDLTGFFESLRKDGLQLTGGQLVDAETDIINVPAQKSSFERALDATEHDDKETVRHHLREAERYHAGGNWGAAASEWRNVFEECIRGAWRHVRSKDSNMASRLEKPPFRDVPLWLLQAGFFNEEEKECYGAAFGFLSFGNHPGIKEEQLAFLSRTLSLPLSNALLLKLGSWTGKVRREER